MTEKIRARKHHILKLVLEDKAGLSIDEIDTALNISRNAVQQHFTVLERDGYIQQTGVLNKTAGRPVRSFVLTAAGINSFQKRYAWFSELILTDLKTNSVPNLFSAFSISWTVSCHEVCCPNLMMSQHLGWQHSPELVAALKWNGWQHSWNTQ